MTRWTRSRLAPLFVVLAIPFGILFINAVAWFVIPMIPVSQTITVLGDASAAGATVLLDGTRVGALKDTIDYGPDAGQPLKDPQESFRVAQGKHRFTVISSKGDTLSCDVITKEHELVEVDFTSRSITARARIFD